MEVLLANNKKPLFKKKSTALNKETEEILFFLYETKEKLDYAELCLNYADTDLMIDSYIYELLALKNKLDYYLRLSKEKGICINMASSLKKIKVS